MGQSHLPNVHHGTVWPEVSHVSQNGKLLFGLRKEHNCDNFEPCSIVGNGNCLYRSVSKGIFKSDQYWPLIKLGTLLSLKININELIKVGWLYHFPSLFLDFYEKYMSSLKAKLEAVV